MHLINFYLGVPILEKELAGLEFILSAVEGLQSFLKRKGFTLQSLTQHYHNDQNSGYSRWKKAKQFEYLNRLLPLHKLLLDNEK